MNYKEQVEILSLIDKKIGINKEINDNLEQQIYIMFQKSFMENANINWPTGILSDLGTIVGGGTPSNIRTEYYTNNGIPWITPKDLINNKSKFISHGETDITVLGLENSNASIMPRGTVLFSSSIHIGYIAIAAEEITTNQSFKSVIPHSHIGSEFVYCFLKYNVPTIKNIASRSIFKEVSTTLMNSLQVKIPEEQVLVQFRDFCRPIFVHQEQLEKENIVLFTIRELLLPKLITGGYEKWME